MSLFYGLSFPPLCFPLDVWIVSCWELGKMSGSSSSLPSSALASKGTVLQIPNQLISKRFSLVDGNKGTLLLTVRKVVSNLKSTDWIYCTWGIWVCPLWSLQRSKRCLAHARHVISFPLRVPTTPVFASTLHQFTHYIEESALILVIRRS